MARDAGTVTFNTDPSTIGGDTAGLHSTNGVEGESRSGNVRISAFAFDSVSLATGSTVEVVGKSAELVRAHPKRFKSDGARDVEIHPARGQPVLISVGYYRSTGASKRVRRKGMYPALIPLGIHERRTPAAGSEIALLAAAMASLKEAAHMFERQGRQVDPKTIRSIGYRYARRVRAAIEAEPFAFPDTVGGRRIGVSVDGGRLRVRTGKRGQHTPKGRKRYHTKWREPKLLHIWALNSEGYIDRSFLPVIDGTLQGPEHIFMLLRYYLRQLEVQSAAAVLFIADGARWIWSRFQRPIAEFSLNPRNVFQFLDFYHAVENLGALASLWKAPSAGASISDSSARESSGTKATPTLCSSFAHT